MKQLLQQIANFLINGAALKQGKKYVVLVSNC